MNKYKRGFRKKLSQHQLQKSILTLLRKNPRKLYSLGTISSKLKAKNSKDAVRSALKALLKDHKVLTDNKGRFAIHPAHAKEQIYSKVTLEGTVDLTASGGAYIIVHGKERDTYIPQKHVNGALQGDTVEIEVRKQIHGRRAEGRIKRIIKRKRVSFIGIFQDFKKYGYAFVETQKMSLEIRILPEDFNNAEAGDGVVVDVIDFGHGKQQEILGKVVKVLPRDNRNDFEMNSILVNNGFDLAFPDEALEEMNHIRDTISVEEVALRRDMRDILTITIDPRDAKDFDDAISFQQVNDDSLEIGVHIADVTHYLKSGTALDKEAYKRSTSVYLVDRVCPMLPERLSNELCSLRPNEDKLTFSVVFTFNKKRDITDVWMGKTVTHSDHRFTYEQAQQSIQGESQIFSEELQTINSIAKNLNEERFKKGSINFDSDEVKFELDEKGAPVKIVRKVRVDAHKLVEEFMLLSNKKVAAFIAKKIKAPEIPMVYRVHDLPDPDKLMELALLASEFGIRLNFDTPTKITHSLNQLSSDEVDDDIKSILRPMAIRCMAKAEYSADNIGHYGLGFSHYSHFTSPIRRYSDVLAHRILFTNLKDIKRTDKKTLEEQCHYISLREKDAVTAERESIKYKQVEYYASRVGNEEEGVIRNIIDRGIFIELADSQADGFIGFDFIGEHVVVHPARIKVTGMSTGSVWSIGDRVNVIIEKTDLEKRQIDLSFSYSTLDEGY